MLAVLLTTIPVLIIIGLSVLVARWLSGRRANPAPLKNGVVGTAEVVSVGVRNSNGNYSTGGTGFCRMDVVLTAPGILATAAKYAAEINTSTPPRVGMKLPASIDPTNPQKFVILWGQLPDRRVVAQAQAERLAADLRGREGKTLARGLVLEITGSPDPADADRQTCSIRLQIFMDGQTPMIAEGVRSLSNQQVSLLHPGRTFTAVWADARSPNSFVLDFSQNAPEVRLGRETGTNSREWLKSNGTDGTVRVLSKGNLALVRNYRGDHIYVLNVTVTSADPPFETQMAEAIPQDVEWRVQPGAELPVKIGTSPSNMALSFIEP
ncbi:MAG: hypothetical protein JWQ64_2749 [Subtercola sp.]|nr:hypothetical protein [Subtercola sp.]